MTKITDEAVKAFTQYRRSQVAELRPWQPGDDMSGVSVSAEDAKAGSPKSGDMIARNPKNHADQWLVAAAYFADNFEPLAALPHLSQGAVRVKPLEWVRGWMNAEAQSAIGLYIITYRRDGSFDWHVGDHNGWASSWDEAKAAAQAHYERHTLSPAPVGVTGKLKQKKSMLDECCSAIKPCFYQQSDPYSLCDPCKRAKTLASHEPAPRDVCEKCRGNGGWNTAGAMIAEGMYETIWNLCPDCGPGYALRRVREIAVLSEAAPDCMAEIIKVADMALGEKTPLPGWMIEPAPTDTQEGLSEAGEVVAFLVDCFEKPSLEFANVLVPAASIPLVRQSALTACQQEVERLKAEIEAAKNDLRGFLTTFVHEHFPENKIWEPFPDLLGMLSQMDNASTIARDYVARNAELAKALEPFAEVAFDEHDDLPGNTVVVIKHEKLLDVTFTLGDFRRARVALGRAEQ